jgi:hypothetical protein
VISAALNYIPSFESLSRNFETFLLRYFRSTWLIAEPSLTSRYQLASSSSSSAEPSTIAPFLPTLQACQKKLPDVFVGQGAYCLANSVLVAASRRPVWGMFRLCWNERHAATVLRPAAPSGVPPS